VERGSHSSNLVTHSARNLSANQIDVDFSTIYTRVVHGVKFESTY